MTPGMTMTAEQFDALSEDDGRDWFLLHGVLVEAPSPTPRQRRTLMRIAGALEGFTRDRICGAVLLFTDLALGNNTRLRPDFTYFTADVWQTVDLKRAPVMQLPVIAAEVLSRLDDAEIVSRKVEAYLKWGVEEVWLIEPEIRTLFVHTLAGAQRLSEGAMLTSEFVPGWRIQISDLFENL